MEHDVHLVFAEDALHQQLAANVAANDPQLVEDLGLEHRALRHPVTHETHGVSPELDQTLREPPAKKAGGAGDECRPVAPEPHYHTFHGARRSAQSDSSKRMSRTVSIGCQNPSCR